MSLISFRKCLVSAALGLAGASTMAAQVLGGYGPLPGGPNGWQTDASTGSMTQSVSSVAGTLESIVWWGYWNPQFAEPADSSFEVSLNGITQTGPLSKFTDTLGVTRYELDVADVAWSGGSASLELLANDLGTEWYWQMGNLSGVELQAMQLLGTVPGNPVPEPETLALVLASLAGMGAARRRRR